MQLEYFDSSNFDRGASRYKETLWLVTSMIFSSWIPGSTWRCWLLRRFGADIGSMIVIKPGVRVKFPWRLKIGNNTWIGQDVWIDNLAQVTIGSNCCISQGAYLCTGSHDWTNTFFSLIVREIEVGKGCWIAARAALAPGAIMEDGAVLAMCAFGFGVITKDNVHTYNGTSKPRYKDGAQ